MIQNISTKNDITLNKTFFMVDAFTGDVRYIHLFIAVCLCNNYIMDKKSVKINLTCQIFSVDTQNIGWQSI
jgi:hypothetical protein